jgi:hypothetical protein
MTLAQLKIAGLDPSIPRPRNVADNAGHRVDARVKLAHDDFRVGSDQGRATHFRPRTALRFRGNDEVASVSCAAPQGVETSETVDARQ